MSDPFLDILIFSLRWAPLVAVSITLVTFVVIGLWVLISKSLGYPQGTTNSTGPG